MAFFDRLKSGLARTRAQLLGRTAGVFSRPLDEAALEELEETLILADIGPATAAELIESLRQGQKRGGDPRGILREEMRRLLGEPAPLLPVDRPYVIMVVGVNGAGKTTSIGKIARRYHDEGQQVTLAAADTFRAAAVEQLEIWARRAGAHFVRHQSGSDPAAVAYDAVVSARSRDADVVIIDTAGRLHTQKNLMEELKKIHRVVGKAMEHAPHEVLLVLDATTGQNALQQARVFNEKLGLTGIILTKLDGSAKGGMIFSVRRELGLPVRLIGVGEGVDDLQDFDPAAFVEALFASSGEARDGSPGSP